MRADIDLPGRREVTSCRSHATLAVQSDGLRASKDARTSDLQQSATCVLCTKQPEWGPQDCPYPEALLSGSLAQTRTASLAPPCDTNSQGWRLKDLKRQARACTQEANVKLSVHHGPAKQQMGAAGVMQHSRHPSSVTKKPCPAARLACRRIPASHTSTVVEQEQK